MSLEKLKSEILEDAEATIKRILSQADEEVKDIISEAERTAELIKQRRREEILKRMEEKEKAVLSRARLSGKRLLLLTEEELFRKVYEEVKDKLANLDRDEAYLKVLINYIVEAVNALKENKIILSLNAKDKLFLKEHMDRVLETVEAKTGNVELMLSDEDLDIMGGIIAYTVDGSKIYNNSLDARLKMIMDDYRSKIMNILLGE
ncbi:MAG: hypothetical protein J7J22_04820 [Candidatus Verstraetearchaeota archaeon]|nr:hypothetical protein [Candidatus Verstraetearchaeota archaeon]